MYREFRQKDDQFTAEMEDEVDYAMTRQEGLNVPMFKQDFAFRLVKLNQIEHSMWGTDFIKKVYSMIQDLDEVDNAAAAASATTAGGGLSGARSTAAGRGAAGTGGPRRPALKNNNSVANRR